MTSSSEGGINDEEVFEINDFTVVTALESFIVGIEATVYSWGLGKGSCSGNRFSLNRVFIGRFQNYLLYPMESSIFKSDETASKYLKVGSKIHFTVNPCLIDHRVPVRDNT